MNNATRSSRDEHRPFASNERSPLLDSENIVPTTEPETGQATTNLPAKDEDRPLPIGQLMLLCMVRVVEPIAFFLIFAFVNEMVQKNGNLPEAEVGFYSGLIESCFSLIQMVTMLFWGRLSDHFGRKPVLIVSMVAITITTTVFGLATKIWHMVLIRCLNGAFCGTIVTLRTMVSEISTPRTQARAFSYFTFAGSAGVFIGPLLGGALANPARQYGGWFKTVPFFLYFPYALPTFVAGALCAVATMAAICFIEETRPGKKSKHGKSANAESKEQSLTTWQLLRYPGVLIVLAMYSHVLLIGYSNTAVSPVYWFTSVDAAGYGFSPLQISIFLSVAGATQAIWILFAFPPLERRYGIRPILRVGSYGYIFVFLTFPFGHFLLQSAKAQDSQWQVTFFWVIMLALLCVNSGVSPFYVAIQLCINNISPSPAVLGTLNGVALAASSGVRSFAPALSTSIFSLGVKYRILGGQLIWLVLIGFVIVLILIVNNLPEKAGTGTAKTSTGGEGEQEQDSSSVER